MTVLVAHTVVNLSVQASAARRADEDLIDNFGRYTEDQLGLFHAKMVATRMIANEFWGSSGCPWSLWRIHSLLGRKMFSHPGWKQKKPPAFPPIWELLLVIVLPANILDSFRIYCGESSLDKWAENVSSLDDIKLVAKQIQLKLTSRKRVYTLREEEEEEKRDLALENIILFNHDTLTLRELKYAIKRGDIGSVVNILALWMTEFRGTGSMPRYAEACP